MVEYTETGALRLQTLRRTRTEQLVPMFEPITFSLHLNNRAVMNKPIHNCCG